MKLKTFENDFTNLSKQPIKILKCLRLKLDYWTYLKQYKLLPQKKGEHF